MTYERDNIRRMRGYVWGEQPNEAGTCKLNTNENPYPPSPEVRRALAAFDNGRAAHLSTTDGGCSAGRAGRPPWSCAG